jgi:ankyrin repeat protein
MEYNFLTESDDKILLKMLSRKKNGLDPNELFIKTYDDSYYETTPLHEACFYNRPNIVFALLMSGADPNVKNCMEQTPLLFLANFRKLSLTPESCPIINALLKSGANINAQDDLGRTVLQFIVLDKGHSEQFKYFLKNGADPSIENINGKTAYDLADKTYTKIKLI